jgi:Rrf2 family transcriptional regulator, iron-sulfur cluster assembly transcription factor
MSVLFSRECEYALQAAVYLALKPAGRLTPIKELTAKLGIPHHFLAKILQRLTRKGILVSLKGPTGGFRLADEPEKVTLFRIVEAIDGNALVTSCIMGFSQCSGKNPCAVHDHWAKLRDGVHTMLAEKSIGEISPEMRKSVYQNLLKKQQ